MSVNQTVKLSEICQIESGGTPSSKNPSFWGGEINWVTLVDVKNKYVNSTRRKITEEGLKHSSAKILPVGTVLFSSRATIGEVAIANVRLATNQGFKNFICNSKRIIPEYLYYVLKKEARNIASLASSTTFKEISKSKIGEYKIVLPSIDEQKKIVEKLNYANELLEKRLKTTSLLDKYVSLIFIDIFGNPARNVNEFEIVQLKDLSNKITDGEHTTPIRSVSGIKLLSARNVKNGFIDYEPGVDYISKEEYERIAKRCMPEFGDVLISCSGTVGRVTAINIKEPFTLVRSVALIKPKRELINALYLEHYLRTKYLQALMLRSVNQSSQANLFLGQINKLPILVPPMDLQMKFVDHIKKVENLKSNMHLQGSEFKSLVNSQMQSSFL